MSPRLSVTNIRLRVNENGRASLPAAFRRALNIRPGDSVLARLEGAEVRITTLKHQRRLRKFVKPGRSLADELIAERREAARHE